MRILNLTQGTPEWRAARAKYFTASEAPIMMGDSKRIKRTELLHMKATGTEKEYSDWVQKNLFDKGHALEASARPIAESIIGEELYPATAVCDEDYLLASFDGITMDDRIIWEHKQWNEEKASTVQSGQCPVEDAFQVQQQLLVSGAEKCLYMMSDGTENRCVHLWLLPNEKDQQFILAGWQQFEEDLNNYEPAPKVVEVVGRSPGALPALHIEVTGKVTASNLQQFCDHSLNVFKGISTELDTDQDFADAEKTVKWCKEVEKRLSAAKDHALSQTQSIDELFKAIDDISGEARTKRLQLEKLVKARKSEIREEIAMSAAKGMTDHIEQINQTFDGRVRMPAIPANFSGVMKGKRTFASLRDAVSTELARAKIEANQIADKIRINLETLRTATAGYETLFSDIHALVLKDGDDLRAAITARIAEHREAEEKRKQEEEQLQEEAQRFGEQVDRDRERAQKSHIQPANPSISQVSSPSTRRRRPCDAVIIGTIATQFRVNESTVMEWLMDMDLQSASKALASNF
ncbi:YqaJ viral recombinase family protein [uncultured Microbulbifer sp.]|uniref:YqaJ viral recombinase family protein n=1 Tax=uncultured Microbulbifer sp. TaxID=348147 RepID=UPI002605CEB9|nr:YqaJ viral recombinase family protein [uncultured Microbulbifer sp.]